MEPRAIIIVLDSVGIGAAEDASLYGDQGSHTLKNTAAAVGGLNLPHLAELGLGLLDDIKGVPAVEKPLGSFGIMQERSKGKDTTTGHWEMMGIYLDKPFPTYPHGFPLDVIAEFEKQIGIKTIGNVVASGTVIIQELGPEHIKTGYPIVYTSADSVFQIAAHEDVVPLEKLYEYCRIARRLLTGEHGVGRVIARPFIGEPGNFIRTSHRHDFSLEPGTNVLDAIVNRGQEVIGIGKIKDIFAGRGVTKSYSTKNNADGLQRITGVLDEEFAGLVFANLIDFDQQYGHRNDPQGYASALEQFDRSIPAIMAAMGENDLLAITADHGCDPTTSSTDHSRENVPLLVYGPGLKAGISLGKRASFADLGLTVADHLGVAVDGIEGQSFYDQIKDQGNRR
jgi:phosphopentomutase